MINEIYINSAKNIVLEYNRCLNRLGTQEKDLTKIYENIKLIAKDLELYKKNIVAKIKDISDATMVTDHIIKKMAEMEAEEQRVLRLVQPINDDIEKLKKESDILIKKIKEKYPSLTDAEINKQLQMGL